MSNSASLISVKKAAENERIKVRWRNPEKTLDRISSFAFMGFKILTDNGKESQATEYEKLSDWKALSFRFFSVWDLVLGQ